MSIIIIIAAIWGASALIRAAKETKRQREIERINREAAQRSAEQERLLREWREQKERAKAETQRMVDLEREQIRQAKEQERLAKEQEKQAAQIAKHDKRIADLEYRMTQAESDISFLQERIGNLDAQRDYLLLQQSGTVPGGKEHTKYQTKIISIDNQIHAAEAKLAKAEHTRMMAKKELEAA